jgi:hypothetical protein
MRRWIFGVWIVFDPLPCNDGFDSTRICWSPYVSTYSKNFTFEIRQLLTPEF